LNFTDNIKQAIRDYAHLLGRGYPEKRTLELVADRHHLDQGGRAVLYRGVFREEVNIRRGANLLKGQPPANSILKVDALNQLYTLVSYFSGQLVFIASDGLLRDASGFHGAPVKGPVLDLSVRTMFSYFEERKDLSVELFLDEQADSRASMRDALLKANAVLHQAVRVTESDQVDAILSTGHGFVVATSDSTISDRSPNPVFDLARHVLEADFSAKIPRISEILLQL
jgi:hypothetical protein